MTLNLIESRNVPGNFFTGVTVAIAKDVEDSGCACISPFSKDKYALSQPDLAFKGQVGPETGISK